MSAPEWEVRLRLVSESRSVAELTALVGMHPDRSSDRGTFRRGSSLARRFSSWEIESDLDASRDVSQHVSRIVERLMGHTDALRRAAALADGLELSIVGRFDPRTDDRPGVNLTDGHVAFLGSVCASIDLEVIPAPTDRPPVI